MKFRQVPCSTGILSHHKNNGALSAIFQRDTIWKPGDQGIITITFGNNGAEGCSGCASWSAVGSSSNQYSPSMNLGFIDPPFGDSFVGVNGNIYQLPKFNADFCPCGSSDCACDCGGANTEDRNATRNYCSTGSTSTSQCMSSSIINGYFTGANWTPGSTIMHEFGHALGMLHEHQNNQGLTNSLVPDPKNPTKTGTLNIQNIYKYYTNLTGDKAAGAEQASTNVLTFYSNPSTYLGSSYDPKSIMLYYLPNSWINGCEKYSDSGQICPYNPTYPNFVLSDIDKTWLQNEYPKTSDSSKWPVLTVRFIDSEAEAWKMAWVIKVINDNYVPIIGIRWIFKDSQGKTLFDSPHTLTPNAPTSAPITGSSIVEPNTDAPTEAPTFSPTSAPTGHQGTYMKPLTKGQLVLVIFSVLVGLLILLGILKHFNVI